MVREFFPLLEFLLESNNHSGGVWRLLSYVPDGFPVEMYGTILMLDFKLKHIKRR